MGRTNLTLKLLTACLTVAVVMGCSKPSSEEAPGASPEPQATKNSPPPPPPPLGSQVAKSAKAQPQASAVQPLNGIPIPRAATQTTQSNTPPAAEIAGLEKEYQQNAEFSKRVEVIYKITDVGSPEVIPALGRIFAAESDPELKTEIVDSLADVDGQDENKLAVLSAAVGVDQPKEVRQAAIDALTDIEPPQRALTVLQALLNDTDSDIREDAKDTIDELQTIIKAMQ